MGKGKSPEPKRSYSLTSSHLDSLMWSVIDEELDKKYERQRIARNARRRARYAEKKAAKKSNNDLDE